MSGSKSLYESNFSLINLVESEYEDEEDKEVDNN